MLSASHLFLIFLIVLLLFGAKRLPEIARSMGKAVNEFKKAKDEVVDAVAQDSAKDSKDAKPQDGAKSADEAKKA